MVSGFFYDGDLLRLDTHTVELYIEFFKTNEEVRERQLQIDIGIHTHIYIYIYYKGATIKNRKKILYISKNGG